MYATFKRNNHSIMGCQMTSFGALLIITFLITLIDAQLEEPNPEYESRQIGDTSKRAGFLPSRGRRFWSIFDWSDSSGEKRMSRFLPMRGRKAGFLPSRGKKSFIPEYSDDYSYGHPLNSYLDNYSDNMAATVDDGLSLSPQLVDSRGPAMAAELRTKKAFHAMRGKKDGNSDPQATYLGPLSSSSSGGADLKRSMSFFGARG